MDIDFYLNYAARLAWDVDTRQDYFLAAIGFRSDGALVRATNKTTRSPSPVVFVVRVTADRAWAKARPCARCMNALRHRRVRKVFYTIGPREYGVIAPGGG
jgi:hypothetical protein